MDANDVVRPSQAKDIEEAIEPLPLAGEAFAANRRLVDLKLLSRLELSSGVVAMRYEPRR